VSDLFDKPALRTRLRALRRTLAAENPEAGAQAAMWLPLDRLPRYRVYALYHPRGSEIDPAPLFHPAARPPPPRAAAVPALERPHAAGA
jgi:5-formyltetrahydrofolate cyclo-ligase